LYLVRQYVTDEGITGLWAAPEPGLREASSDASHREAQEKALDNWIRMEWTGTKFIHYVMTEEDDLGEPVFPDTPFEEILLKGLSKYLIRDAKHPLCKRLLRGTLNTSEEGQTGASV
jgi:hypothetical protein